MNLQILLLLFFPPFLLHPHSKPWIGTVAALTPDGAPKNNASLPSAQLALEWVYGIKSDDTRQHVHIDARNRIVFPAAAGTSQT